MILFIDRGSHYVPLIIDTKRSKDVRYEFIEKMYNTDYISKFGDSELAVLDHDGKLDIINKSGKIYNTNFSVSGFNAIVGSNPNIYIVDKNNILIRLTVNGHVVEPSFVSTIFAEGNINELSHKCYMKLDLINSNTSCLDMIINGSDYNILIDNDGYKVTKGTILNNNVVTVDSDDYLYACVKNNTPNKLSLYDKFYSIEGDKLLLRKLKMIEVVFLTSGSPNRESEMNEVRIQKQGYTSFTLNIYSDLDNCEIERVSLSHIETNNIRIVHIMVLCSNNQLWYISLKMINRLISNGRPSDYFSNLEFLPINYMLVCQDATELSRGYGSYNKSSFAVIRSDGLTIISFADVGEMNVTKLGMLGGNGYLIPR